MQLVAEGDGDLAAVGGDGRERGRIETDHAQRLIPLREEAPAHDPLHLLVALEMPHPFDPLRRPPVEHDLVLRARGEGLLGLQLDRPRPGVDLEGARDERQALLLSQLQLLREEGGEVRRPEKLSPVVRLVFFDACHLDGDDSLRGDVERVAAGGGEADEGANVVTSKRRVDHAQTRLLCKRMR
eukprot:20811-Hanusia_phi.AAC.1